VDGPLCFWNKKLILEEVPQELVVDLMVVLHFGGFDEGAERARAAIGGSAFQVGVAAFDVGAEELGGPVGFFKMVDGRVDVVRKIPLGLAKILDFEVSPSMPLLKIEYMTR